MEATFDPEEGQEGKIQRTILLWMRTFHPKEALFHMEEGSMLAEEGLFHPEEPLFLLWVAMTLPREGTFLLTDGAALLFQSRSLSVYPLVHPKERLVLIEEEWLLVAERLFHSALQSFLLRDRTMLPKEELILAPIGLPVPEKGIGATVYRGGLVYRKPPSYRRVPKAAGDGRPPKMSQRVNRSDGDAIRFA